MSDFTASDRAADRRTARVITGHTRDVIAQAKVIAMAHHGVDPETASEMLRRASQREGCSLRDVAQDIVDRNRASLTEPGSGTGR